MRSKKESIDTIISDFLGVPDEEKSSEIPEKEIHPGLFDYVKDVCYNKQDILAREMMIQNGIPSELNPYMLIKALGNNFDTVSFANAMNCLQNVPPEAQYYFYLYGIPKKKRFAKFYSPDNFREKALNALSKYFMWGRREAETNIKMFSKDELDEIIRRVSGDRRKN